MNKKHFLILALVVVVLSSFSASTDDVLNRIVAGYKKYIQEFPQEKVYLHFDRPYYTNQDTIWFKAYLTAGEFHEPSPLSRTVYVELINVQGKLLKQLKLLVIDGSAAGDFALPDSLASGNYLVRAYTNWMRNGDEEYFYHRLIKIWNKGEQISSSQENAIDLQFFPEGGNLINGIVSKVAFKAIGSDGLAREITGKVIDETGVVVVQKFKSNLLGMGSVFFVPKKGKSYRAVVDELSVETKLPDVKDSGITVAVRNSPTSNEVTMRVQATTDDAHQAVYVIAQTRGVVCYTARVDISTHAAMVKIPKSVFPIGVAQLTVVDVDGNPLVERLTFIDKKKSIFVKVSSIKAIYASREKVTLQIQATDTIGAPVVADLSLAACDDQEVSPNNNQENIYTYLLLSSELRGNIESPNYYFNATNTDRYDALDNLLLTQGWRRFTIKKALETQWQQPQYKIEQGLTIKGKLTDTYNNKPVADGKVTYMTSVPPDTKVVKTDATGSFEISPAIYFDSAQVVLQGETKKGAKWTRFVLDNDKLIDFPKINFSTSSFQNTSTAFEKSFLARSIEMENIDKQYKAIVLKEVVVRANKLSSDAPTRIYGMGSVAVSVAGNPAMENMMHPLQLLQGRVAGVLVTGAGLTWSATIRGAGSISSDSSPLLLIDDMPVTMETLASLPVQNIESFTVWKGPDAAIFGVRGSGGAIGFYTKKGMGFTRGTDGIFTFTKIGFQTERDFYVPKYDVKNQTKPDKRITLFWAPHVKTDSTGKASVSFYNHDIETTVTATVEGISTTGKPLVASYNYSIKK